MNWEVSKWNGPPIDQSDYYICYNYILIIARPWPDYTELSLHASALQSGLQGGPTKLDVIQDAAHKPHARKIEILRNDRSEASVLNFFMVNEPPIDQSDYCI